MLYILININPDGDTYKLYNYTEEGLKQAQADFEESKEEFITGAVLAEVEPGQEFGFGNRGHFFGGHVLQEWNEA